ncbi:phosphate transport system regulator PhoU [Psychromonas sp. B3M02]|uniref:phosphate signaling complex protein PhoU n=1 Tax=unclassified Psychromonas TaxID=2614957 RepID=UPI000DE8D9DF|nr:phosphate signaling complex protein PhoU [Psychromonas sp. B3M02]RBW47695.1 phosphate transport system regulator PhoU [Psychromonas sp. B3M02]
MENLNLNRHISGQFNTELESVRNQVMQMGGLIEQQLIDALTAMADNDLELAREVIVKDNEVNQFETRVDQECSRIIAKRQPAATDLRLILTIMKTVTELERVGDSVAAIAKMAIENHGKKVPSLIGLENMGQIVIKMLHNSLDSFTRLDLNTAIAVHNEDKKVNRQYESILRELMTFMMEDPRSVPFVLNVLASARAIERIGDRCQNICEQVVYLVKGIDVRHATEEEINSLIEE